MIEVISPEDFKDVALQRRWCETERMDTVIGSQGETSGSTWRTCTARAFRGDQTYDDRLAELGVCRQPRSATYSGLVRCWFGWR